MADTAVAGTERLLFRRRSRYVGIKENADPGNTVPRTCAVTRQEWEALQE